LTPVEFDVRICYSLGAVQPLALHACGRYDVVSRALVLRTLDARYHFATPTEFSKFAYRTIALANRWRLNVDSEQGTRGAWQLVEFFDVSRARWFALHTLCGESLYSSNGVCADARWLTGAPLNAAIYDTLYGRTLSRRSGPRPSLAAMSRWPAQRTFHVTPIDFNKSNRTMRGDKKVNGLIASLFVQSVPDTADSDTEVDNIFNNNNDASAGASPSLRPTSNLTIVSDPPRLPFDTDGDSASSNNNNNNNNNEGVRRVACVNEQDGVLAWYETNRRSSSSSSSSFGLTDVEPPLFWDPVHETFPTA
jgi:hypothetical protein